MSRWNKTGVIECSKRNGASTSSLTVFEQQLHWSSRQDIPLRFSPQTTHILEPTLIRLPITLPLQSLLLFHLFRVPDIQNKHFFFFFFLQPTPQVPSKALNITIPHFTQEPQELIMDPQRVSAAHFENHCSKATWVPLGKRLFLSLPTPKANAAKRIRR